MVHLLPSASPQCEEECSMGTFLITGQGCWTWAGRVRLCGQNGWGKQIGVCTGVGVEAPKLSYVMLLGNRVTII